MKYIYSLVVFMIAFSSNVFAQSPYNGMTPWPQKELPLLAEDYLNNYNSNPCRLYSRVSTIPSMQGLGCISEAEIYCAEYVLENTYPDGYDISKPASNVWRLYFSQMDLDGSKIVDRRDFKAFRGYVGCYNLGDKNLNGLVTFDELEYAYQRFGSSSLNSAFLWSIGDEDASGKVTNEEMMKIFNNLNEVNGDANLDGCVNTKDMTILATNYGKTSGGFWKIGDFNRDTKIDIKDYTILRNNYGNCRTVSTRTFLRGDFNYNGCVDAADVTVWRDNYGKTVNRGSGADANFDGFVDGADYVIFQQSFNNGCNLTTPVATATVTAVPTSTPTVIPTSTPAAVPVDIDPSH